MALKDDFNNLGRRLADFSARFDEQTTRKLRQAKRSRESGPFQSAYWTVYDLFTRDVTREGLRDLIKRETTDTVRFFTREIDFAGLRSLPWYQRYPATAWQVFVAMAYRLSPPRRIAFAVALIAFILGWIQLMSFSARDGDGSIRLFPEGSGWWLLSIVLLVLLLLMELRDKLDLKGDLEIAREIQFGLVPARPYQRDRFVMHYFMRPANTVGGDYYDIIELDERRVALVMGDVAGKGMPAALLMALLQGSLRTLITAGLRGPELMSRLNDYLCDNIPDNRLVTLFYGELDTVTGELQYVNAGHNAPYLIYGDQSIKRLTSTAMVLGFTRDCAFEVGSAELTPGARAVLFTDGIVEAFNTADEEYGETRLERCLGRSARLRHMPFIRALIDDVLAFCGESRPGDDITVLTIEPVEPDAAACGCC